MNVSVATGNDMFYHLLCVKETFDRVVGVSGNFADFYPLTSVHQLPVNKLTVYHPRRALVNVEKPVNKNLQQISKKKGKTAVISGGLFMTGNHSDSIVHLRTNSS